jgi:hypothetical protein
MNQPRKKMGRENEPETVAHSVSNPCYLSTRQCRQGAVLSEGDVKGGRLFLQALSEKKLVAIRPVSRNLSSLILE